MLLAHISDIHLCLENGGRKQRRLVIGLMKSALNRGVEHFLLAGDIVEYCNHRELKRFLQEVERAGIEPGQLSIIPGNHDVFPVSAKNLWRSLFHFSKHPKYYERFFEICRGHFGEILLRKPLIYFRQLNENLVLFAADSNDYRARTHRTSGRGYLSSETWTVIDEAIEKYGFQNHKKILMTHHYPFECRDKSAPIQKRGVDMDFVNLKDVQENIQSRDWLMVLCGHSHRHSGVQQLGNIPVINSASRPNRDHYVCSIIDTDSELIPKRLETNLDRRLRMIFTRHQRE